jgi:CheY-like chemotaxis protein
LRHLERAATDGDPFALALVDGKMPGLDGYALLAELQRRPSLHGVRAVLTSSDAPRFGQSAPARVPTLMKPILGGQLLEALLEALGETGAAAPKDDGPSTAAGPARRLDLLVAEDNEINQELVLQLLTRAGHAVALARTGREAVQLVGERRFDAVLMDVQMPDLDGFEATALIRTLEQTLGRRTPILALTAHAMRGDEERCLAAGMDGYLTKPLEWPTLSAALDRFVLRAGSQAQELVPPRPRVKTTPSLRALESRDDSSPLDLARAMRTVDGDERLLAKVAGMFARKLPRLLDGLQKAHEGNEPAQLHAGAHSIVGAAQNLGALRLAQAAQALEQQSLAANQQEIPVLLGKVSQEVERLLPVLERLAL